MRIFRSRLRRDRQKWHKICKNRSNTQNNYNKKETKLNSYKVDFPFSSKTMGNYLKK